MKFHIGALGDDPNALPPAQLPTDTSTPPTQAGGWLQNLVQGFAQYKLAQQQLDAYKTINAQRAAQGLPPLAYDPSTIGAPQVRVGLAPETQTLIVYGMLAGLGIFALNAVLKR
jgi:hypothetical protein